MSSLCYEVIFNMRWTYVFYTLAYGYVVCYTAVFSVVTQRSSPLEALRDDTKNGCVTD